MPNYPFPPEGDPEDDPDLPLSERLSRRASWILNLILYSDVPWLDIELEINGMRWMVEEESPDRLNLFERVYAARFEWLRQMWREEEPSFS